MSGIPRVRDKWRPPLGLVVLAVLLAVLAVPSAFVLWVRVLEARSTGTAEIVVLVVALILTLIVAYVLTRTITGPIDALVSRTREIGSKGRAAIAPLKAYGTREIATLSQSFLELATRLVDRTDYLRSFAAHVSHELKSPLTAIKGAAELLRDEAGAMTPAERQLFLENVIAEADRLSALLGRLRELAQAELPLGAGSSRLDECTEELGQRFPELRLEIVGGSLDLPIPREALLIALGHLADNSARHGATRLILAASRAQGSLRLMVSDDGPGISEGNRELVFQPFFSTRREQGGTGLGLDIVGAMLKSHGGTISLLRPDIGASFEIVFPDGEFSRHSK